MFHTTRKYNKGMRHAGMPCGMARGMTSKKTSSRVIPQPRNGFIGFCASSCWHLSSDEKPQFPRPKMQRDATKTWKTYPRPQTSKNTFFSPYTLKTNPFFFSIAHLAQKKAQWGRWVFPSLEGPPGHEPWKMGELTAWIGNHARHPNWKGPGMDVIYLHSTFIYIFFTIKKSKQI